MRGYLSQPRLQEDARVKVKIIYRLFEGADLLETFDEESVAPSAVKTGGSGAAAGAPGGHNNPVRFSRRHLIWRLVLAGFAQLA